MTGETDASIDITGTAAQNVAGNVLNSLGVDPENIGSTALSFEIDGTTITVEGEGALAGVLTAEMVSGVDWDERDANSVTATVSTGVQANSEGESEPDSEPESVPSTESIEDTEGEEGNGEHPYAGKRGIEIDREGQKKGPVEDYATEDPPIDEPESVTRDTRLHETLWILAQETADGSFVTSGDIYEDYPDVYSKKNLASTALSKLFREHWLCDRKRENNEEGGGVLMDYQINEHGVGVLKDLGVPYGLDAESEDE